MPVFHAGYFKHTLAILQCICKNCSKVLLPLGDRASLLRKITNPKSDALIKGAIFKKIVETCKKTSRCQHCDYANGVVKKLTSGFFKIAHEKYRAKNAADEDDLYQQKMEQIYLSTPELRQHNVKSSVSHLTSPGLLAQSDQNRTEQNKPYPLCCTGYIL